MAVDAGSTHAFRPDQEICQEWGSQGAQKLGQARERVQEEKLPMVDTTAFVGRAPAWLAVETHSLLAPASQ